MTDSPISDLTRLVAATIRGQMAQHGVTQAEMADALGVSQSQFSKMLRGVRSINLDELDGMCVALGLATSDVIKQAETVLSKYDAKYNARYVYVDDGVRLERPFDTQGVGSDEPIIPEYRPRGGRAGNGR